MKKFIVALATFTGLDGAKSKKLLAVAAACLLSTAAHSAEFYKLDEHPTTLLVEGRIEMGDDQRLMNVLMARTERGARTEYIEFNSPGGFVAPAYSMARFIRNMNIDTIIGSAEECSSACMIAFAGGRYRYAWEGAKLGVHSSSIEGVESGDGTVDIARFMTALGAPATVIAAIVTTSSDDITWLSPAHTGNWVTFWKTPGAVTPPAPPTPTVPNIPNSAPETQATDSYSMTCQSTATKTITRLDGMGIKPFR